MTRLLSVLVVAIALVLACAGVAAAVLPVPYFNQRDSLWSSYQLYGDDPERVVDVSKTALDALGPVTDDTVNIEFADQGAELGVVSLASSYDRQAAYDYAIQWWNSCNHDCSGDFYDCTPY